MRDLRARVVRLERLLAPPGWEAELEAAAEKARQRLEALVARWEARLRRGEECVLPYAKRAPVDLWAEAMARRLLGLDLPDPLREALEAAVARASDSPAAKWLLEGPLLDR